MMAVPTRKSVNSNDVTKFAKVVLVIWIAMIRTSRNVSKAREARSRLKLENRP